MTTLRTGTDPARLRRLRPARAPSAFTLVELLVVMGIIGVLVAMLLPAVNQTVAAVRKAACANRVAQIEAGLANFKNDWGIYPPSNTDIADEANALAEACPASSPHGYEFLTVALVGPTADAKGWGGTVKILPLGGSSESVSYGPYYKGEFVWTGRRAFIPDAFPSPDRPILYFRYDRRNATYSHQDNPVGQGLGEGFQSKTHFELSVKYVAPDGEERWHRKDYLLICAGEDRMYGWIKDTDPPQAVTSRSETVEGTATCDDVTNFD